MMLNDVILRSHLNGNPVSFNTCFSATESHTPIVNKSTKSKLFMYSFWNTLYFCHLNKVFIIHRKLNKLGYHGSRNIFVCVTECCFQSPECSSPQVVHENQEDR